MRTSLTARNSASFHLPKRMRYLKFTAAFLFGVALVSISFFGGVSLWAQIEAPGNNSFLDSKPPAVLDALLVAWVGCSAVGGAFGAWLTRRRT
jgi:hypothetical protein